jgi:hypothetical protein
MAMSAEKAFVYSSAKNIFHLRGVMVAHARWT